jgi:hypothetical protein
VIAEQLDAAKAVVVIWSAPSRAVAVGSLRGQSRALRATSWSSFASTRRRCRCRSIRSSAST